MNTLDSAARSAEVGTSTSLTTNKPKTPIANATTITPKQLRRKLCPAARMAVNSLFLDMVTSAKINPKKIAAGSVEAIASGRISR